MEYKWEDLPKPKNCFTVRNAAMIDLATKKPVRCYSANTRITVVQKCTTTKGILYRTRYAKENNLDWAFKASAFGLPDKKAPSAPSSLRTPKPEVTPYSKQTKQKSIQKEVSPDDGAGDNEGWIKKIFRRINGKTKNT